MTPAFYNGEKSFIGALEESHSYPISQKFALAAHCKPIPGKKKKGLP